VKGTNLLLVLALTGFGSCRQEPAPKPSPKVQSSAPEDEYLAWEKLPSGEFKQVKKDYFLNKELCLNVVSVLNDMSTQRPRSNWVLSHTTDSTFECWPARVDPQEFTKHNSTHSDSPAVTSPEAPVTSSHQAPN
jgi:hypothetical protein